MDEPVEVGVGGEQRLEREAIVAAERLFGSVRW
jgi:hypothetical protein